MAQHVNPATFVNEPWWPNVKSLTFDDVFERIPLDEAHAELLLDDVLKQHRRLKLTAAEPGLADEMTLELWASGWQTPSDTPPKTLTKLRVALAAFAKVLAEIPVAEVDPLWPMGEMDLWMLEQRRKVAEVAYPGGTLPVFAGHTFAEVVESRTLAPAITRAMMVRWAQTVGKELRATLAAEAPTRAAMFAGWKEGDLGSLGTELISLRERLASTEVPVDAAIRHNATLRWDELTDSVGVRITSMLGCLTGPCTEVQVALGRSPIGASCSRGSSPCRMKLAAVECVLDVLASAPDAKPDQPAFVALRAHLKKPGWQRMFGRLRTAGSSVPVADEQFGWVVSSTRELEPSWIVAKKPSGWKATRCKSSELEAMVFDTPTDAVAVALLDRDSLRFGTPEDKRQVAARALASLVGSERVYVRNASRELVHVTVTLDEPRVEVVAAAEGPRLVMRWGTGEIPTRDVESPPRMGSWFVALDEHSSTLYVGLWSMKAERAWSALQGSKKEPLPPEAMDALSETLLAVSSNLPVRADASWLGQALEPGVNVVFRLGLEGPKGSRVLHIEGCVKPIEELGAMQPGVGQEMIPVRREGRIAHVVRNLRAERIAVWTIAREAGILVSAAPTSHGPFVWTVEGVEQAASIWTALAFKAKEENSTLHVEWRTKAPFVQRNQGLNKLRLQLGLRKDWLDVKGGLALEGGELPLTELLQALRDKKHFVQVDLEDGDEQLIELSDELIKELAPLAALARNAGTEKDGSIRTNRLAAPLIAELESLGATVEGPGEWLTMSTQLKEAAALHIDAPAELQATLRPYQLEGVQWAARLAHWAKGACLADEMGLGKTVQALALLLRRKDLGRALVIAPTSVVANWIREAARFAPSLSLVAIARGALVGELDKESAVVVTSWDLVVRHEERFQSIQWGTIVFDEAHAMKNPSTRRAQVAKALPAGFVLALTGTPVENRPSELWSLFQTVAPGLLGSADSFRDNFARAIELGDPEGSRRLARLVRPFILRRRKAEVATELPPITEVRVDVVLSAEERERYESVRKAALAEIANTNTAKPGNSKLFKVLVVLTRLRQLASHPRLVDPKAGPHSAKLECLLELAVELSDEGRKMLIFSQFTELLQIVREAFDSVGLTYAYLDGSTPAQQRIGEVDRFQTGDVDAFLLSLKAGGVGLNLTAATEVIHLDPWWNPAVEDQATGRAHRIGQDKPVTVYRLVTEGTIEEQIVSLHNDKRTMVAGLLEGTGTASAVTADELIALLSEEGLEASAPDQAGEMGLDMASVLAAPAKPARKRKS